MWKPALVGLLGLLAVAPPSATPPVAAAEPSRAERLRGFSAEGSGVERAVEARLAALADPQRIRERHRYFTALPHPAGSARNRELAEHIERTWREQGLEQVVLHRYDVLQSMPREIVVEMVAPERRRFSLREAAYPEDPDSAQPGIHSGFLGFSASGDVTAPVVYAQSGNPEDYALLREHGIDPRGKIALVRYSNPYSYRGFKALTAEREGLAGLIIYSDPQEDGYVRGEVFPKGPWGPESHIQRGAITYDFLIAGDPLTPGIPALPDAPRIPIEDAVSVPKIMAVPMAWGEAKLILESLGGPVAPDSWQGGLDLEYRLGGEGAVVHLAVDMDTSVQPNYVVEGRIVGSEFPDEWIVLGNHRDAWEFGGVDPSSGTASMMELTHALGELLKAGIRPRRTLVFGSWDGEEVALTGSTEWGEHFADELHRKGVAYLNVDSSTSGPRFDPGAVGSLAPLVVDVSRSLEAPSGVSLYEEWRGSKDAAAPLADRDLVDTRIGSGSDHTVFLNHLGLPTLLLGFDGPYGVYHSAYDSFYWMEHFGDPGYRYHALMSRLWGTLALRLANADALPFDFASAARHLRGFVEALESAHPGADLEFDPLYARVAALERAGWELDAAIDARLAAGPLTSDQVRELSARTRRFEQNWLDPDGLPGRTWFKHTLYASRYTYAHLELPGLTEAVEAGDWARARDQRGRLERALDANTALLEDARGFVSQTRASLAELEPQLEAIRAAFPGNMSIYARHVPSGETLALDADRVTETFSVIKLAILAEAMRQSEAGGLDLDERVVLKPADGRIPSGVLYGLDPGLQPTWRDLLRLMVIISDNAATDLVADRVGRDHVTAFMRQLGLEHTRIEYSDLDWDRRWLGLLEPAYREASAQEILAFPFGRHSDAEVSDAFRRVIEETEVYFGHSTAREIGALLEGLVRGEVVSAEASRFMLDVMKEQQVDDRFPRYIREVTIAHKTGDGAPWVSNDAGVLWVDGDPIVLVILTSEHRGSAASQKDAIARAAALVARHYGATLTPDFPG